MPTDRADVAVANPDGIDSNCEGYPLGADGPTDERCGDDAVTYVFKSSGHRVYLCREHGEQVNRFDDDAFAGGVPTVKACKRCLKFTTKHRLNHEAICDDCQA